MYLRSSCGGGADIECNDDGEHGSLQSEINILIPDLRGAGATDIVELPISKIVH